MFEIEMSQMGKGARLLSVDIDADSQQYMRFVFDQGAVYLAAEGD